MHHNQKAKHNGKSILTSTIIFAALSILIWGNSKHRLTIKNQTKMFTTAQIKAAHSKVKSGADFPSYIKEIKLLGVTHYETYVKDGHIDYHGGSHYTVTVPANYETLAIANTPKTEEFKAALLAHQQGKSDYLTFIKMCAGTGINKWEICMDKMTCTYYDSAGNKILVEEIPQ